MDGYVWAEGVKAFTKFINVHMDFGMAVFPEKEPMESFQSSRILALWNRRNAVESKKTGVFWEDVEIDSEQECNEDRIRTATKYIREHISQSISRTQVAEMLHINEEYFSRLFKKYTGYTFKDYLTMERINQAKKLLEHSRFSISIIATKVGYDNFSYFSRTFKKVTGQMPQEYRKACEENRKT